jgi:IclR family acetate operon transcriptional repressor
MMTTTSGPDPALAAESGRDYSVRAVRRVCAILNLLQESFDGESLATVALATGLPKSSAFRYLWTLESHRYVERDPASGLYRLGLGFIGMQSRSLELLRQRARPLLTQLRDDLGETINLGVLDGDTAVYLDIVESRRGVRLAVARGSRDALHATALGKVIAADLPRQQVSGILASSGMPALTSRTITEASAFFDELDRVRRAGYAVDDGESEVDGRCVAVAIRGAPVPAGLSVSSPAARLPLEHLDDVVGKLGAAAATISAALGGTVERPSHTHAIVGP